MGELRIVPCRCLDNIERIKKPRVVFPNVIHAAKPPYQFLVWPLVDRDLLGGRYLSGLWSEIDR